MWKFGEINLTCRAYFIINTKVIINYNKHKSNQQLLNEYHEWKSNKVHKMHKMQVIKFSVAIQFNSVYLYSTFYNTNRCKAAFQKI